LPSICTYALLLRVQGCLSVQWIPTSLVSKSFALAPSTIVMASLACRSATFVGAGTSGNTKQESIEQSIVLLNLCLLCSRIFIQQMSVSLSLQTLHGTGNGLHISHIEEWGNNKLLHFNEAVLLQTGRPQSSKLLFASQNAHCRNFGETNIAVGNCGRVRCWRSLSQRQFC
jgi:hypothetical protein